MIDFQHLQTDVWGLANAHRAGTMAGHLGAAVVAGYFFGEDQPNLPDEGCELGAVIEAEHNPRDPAYWQGMLERDEARLTHRIKTLYGYQILRRSIESESQRMRSDDALLYLMA